jgi:hypothetical protein
MHPLETYLTELRDIRASGQAVKETSYYGPLANLLNDIGKTLKTKVRCIITIKNRGAGLPDGGLFTPDQFQKASEAEPLPPHEAPSRSRARKTMPGSWPMVNKSRATGEIPPGSRHQLSRLRLGRTGRGRKADKAGNLPASQPTVRTPFGLQWRIRASWPRYIPSASLNI